LSTETRIRKRLSTEALNDLIIDSIQDIKGKNIVKLDLRQLDDAPTDFFIICEGTSTTQVKSIADNIYKRLKDEVGNMPLHVEGQQSAHWICLDYFDIVVHVFYPDTRAFYQLEDLWSDAMFTEFGNL
jgi:ribosome-associated protein